MIDDWENMFIHFEPNRGWHKLSFHFRRNYQWGRNVPAQCYRGVHLRTNWLRWWLGNDDSQWLCPSLPATLDIIIKGVQHSEYAGSIVLFLHLFRASLSLSLLSVGRTFWSEFFCAIPPNVNKDFTPCPALLWLTKVHHHSALRHKSEQKTSALYKNWVHHTQKHHRRHCP